MRKCHCVWLPVSVKRLNQFRLLFGILPSRFTVAAKHSYIIRIFRRPNIRILHFRWIPALRHDTGDFFNSCRSALHADLILPTDWLASRRHKLAVAYVSARALERQQLSATVIASVSTRCRPCLSLFDVWSWINAFRRSTARQFTAACFDDVVGSIGK